MNRIQDINQTIRNFFEHNYPQAIQQKFRWWMLHHDDKKTSEDVMKQLWDESEATTTDILDEDKRLFQQALRREKRKIIYKHYRPWLIAASLMGAIFLSSYITYNIVENDFYQRQEAQEFVQITVADKDMRKIYLSDSTHVVLNSGSTLIYPKDFTANTRTVFLLGEASFDVRKDARKPFVVQTEYLSVMALGTRFSVTSHSSLSFASTTLASGKIKVEVPKANVATDTRTFVLNPNQGLDYDKKTGKVSIHSTDADRVLSWEKGKLIFDGVRFADVMDCIERKYGVTIVCKDISKMKGLYHAKFETAESVQEVLNLLSKLSHPFEYRIHGNTIQIIPE